MAADNQLMAAHPAGQQAEKAEADAEQHEAALSTAHEELVTAQEGRAAAHVKTAAARDAAAREKGGTLCSQGSGSTAQQVLAAAKVSLPQCGACIVCLSLSSSVGCLPCHHMWCAPCAACQQGPHACPLCQTPVGLDFMP